MNDITQAQLNNFIFKYVNQKRTTTTTTSTATTRVS